MAYNHRKEVERESGVKSRNRVIRWEEVHDPIPESLSEAGYREMFGQADESSRPFFVPYAGWGYNSVHSYLDLLILLAKLSTTHGSCIKNQRYISFGGKIDVVGDRQKYAFQEDIELSNSDKLSHVETISKYIPDFDAKSLMEQAFTWGKKTGDRWYLIEGNKDFAKIEVVDPRKALYYVDRKVDYKVVAIGEGRLDDHIIRKRKYVLVPEYPQIGEYNGGWRTVLHFKDGDNTWYGRPDAEQALIDIFREYKDSEYFLKSSANHFTGRAIFEFEDDPIPNDDDPDDDARSDGHDDLSAQIDANMTNKSADPMTFLAMTRPYGASASVLHQIQSNTPEGFFKFLNDMSVQKIVMAHNWSQKLLGMEDSSGLSTNQFWDIFNIKRIGIIKFYQDRASKELKDCLDVVGQMFGFENNARFVATTPFDQLNEELKKAPSGDGAEGPTIKERIDAYSVGVRSGSITPQQADEDKFREELSLPEIGAEAQKAWTDDDGVRRPITLKSKAEKDAEIDKITPGSPDKDGTDDANN